MILTGDIPPLLRISVPLGCTAGERRIQQMVQLGVDWTEVGISLDALDEVVVTPFLLDHGSCLLREHSDFLMAILGRQEALVAHQ